MATLVKTYLFVTKSLTLRFKTYHKKCFRENVESAWLGFCVGWKKIGTVVKHIHTVLDLNSSVELI